MLIAIISDIHDNIPNLKKALDYCMLNKIEKIICCGDLASLETLDFLNDNFGGEIFYTFGNMDNDFLQNYPNITRPKFLKISAKQNWTEKKWPLFIFPEKPKNFVSQVNISLFFTVTPINLLKKV
jgi:putative phosphoesterase